MKKITLGQFTPFIIPGPNDNEQMCGADFGAVLNNYVARSGRGSVRSAQQAIKNANLNKPTNITNASKVQPLLNAARGFKHVSRGMIFLDIGFRTHNVTHSNTRGRTFTSELAGFGLSYYTGYAGGTIAVWLALGPLGWLIAILVIGAAVVTMDYFGKSLGNYAYDTGASLYSNSILNLNY